MGAVWRPGRRGGAGGEFHEGDVGVALGQLEHETRLADARLPLDPDPSAGTLAQLLEAFAEARELFFASHEGGELRHARSEARLLVSRESQDRTGPCDGADPLEPKRPDFPGLEPIPECFAQLGAGVDRSDRCLALDPRCAIHALTQHGELANDRVAKLASENPPRIDARAQVEGDRKVELARQLRDRAAHLERGANRRAGRVVRVLRKAEDRHQPVSQVLVHRTAVATRLLVEHAQTARDHHVRLVGPARSGELREADDVGEQDRRIAV